MTYTVGVTFARELQYGAVFCFSGGRGRVRTPLQRAIREAGRRGGGGSTTTISFYHRVRHIIRGTIYMKQHMTAIQTPSTGITNNSNKPGRRSSYKHANSGQIGKKHERSKAFVITHKRNFKKEK